MRRIRVIPILLLRSAGFVKTQKFSNPTYLGDPINILKIFNDKEVDEVVILDINATIENSNIQYDLLTDIASECFMPVGYGGGIRSIEDIRKILNLGIEKVSINSHAAQNSDFITEAAKIFGRQSIVVSIDVKRNLFGKYTVYTRSGKNNTKIDPVTYAKEMEDRGAGEILLNSIDNDGLLQGFDIDLIKKVSSVVNIPVIACGGAATVDDFVKAVKGGGASAVAAGSMFVFQGKHRAVLISYPSYADLEKALG
jgi:cyclase